jgi:hypothetical protein
MANQEGSPTEFNAIRFFAPKRIRLLRVLRNLIACFGVFLILLGFLAFGEQNQGLSPVTLSVICFIFGVAVIWLSVCLLGTVQVSRTKIKSQNLLRRSADVDDIEKLDIVRSRWGRQSLLVPVVVRKNGKSFPLRPLVWREQLLARNPGWTPQKQVEVIHEIRESIRVSGQDTPR